MDCLNTAWVTERKGLYFTKYKKNGNTDIVLVQYKLLNCWRLYANNLIKVYPYELTPHQVFKLADKDLAKTYKEGLLKLKEG